MKKERVLILLIYLAGLVLCAGILRFIKVDQSVAVSTTAVGDETGRYEDITTGDITTEEQTTAETTELESDETEGVTEETDEVFQGDRTGFPKTENIVEETEPIEVPTQPEPYRPPVVWLATDLHYYSAALTDYQQAFVKMAASDDGKTTQYSPQLTDAFFSEVIAQKPSVLILSGDLTLNGEKVNHQELASKLEEVEKAGIPVVVIPGNHDINNNNAATYFGDRREKTESIVGEEFSTIYENFGYGEALSRDLTSLSYSYQLDEKIRLIMLDSCQYDPVNIVDGRIQAQTLTWMEEEIKKAKEEGMFVLPVAHHNLLDESLLYPTECTIEDNQVYVKLFEDWDIPLFLSGHLHLQRISRHKQGIFEAVTSSLSIAPCQFGVLTWEEDGNIIYRTQRVDVSSWALSRGITDENLLNFEGYSQDFLIKSVGDKIYEKLEYLPEDQMSNMSELYSKLNQLYCAGLPIDFSQIMKEAGYEQWERNRPDSGQFKEFMAIVRDTELDQNYLDLKNP